MAVVWCHRRTKRNWTGAAPPPQDIHYGGEEFITRSTMMFRKEAGDWRVVHAHFSQASAGERPGGAAHNGAFWSFAFLRFRRRVSMSGSWRSSPFLVVPFF